MTNRVKIFVVASLAILIGIGLFYDPSPLKSGITINATMEIDGKMSTVPVKVSVNDEEAVILFSREGKPLRYTIPVIADGNYIYHQPIVNRRNESAYFTLLVTNRIQEMSFFDGKELTITYINE